MNEEFKSKRLQMIKEAHERVILKREQEEEDLFSVIEYDDFDETLEGEYNV